MTKNHLIYLIKNICQPLNLSDSAITNELLDFMIDETRALLIRQDISKGHSVPSGIKQDLGAIPLIQIDKSDVCTIPVGCLINKTTLELPKFIQAHNREMILRVGPLDITLPKWDLIEYDRVPFENKGKFNFIKSFKMNGNNFLYLLSKDNSSQLLDYVNVQGLLEFPGDASRFTTCEGNPCYDNNSEYPMSANMVNPLIDIIIKKIQVLTNSPIDLTNDNKSNPKPQVNNKEN